MFLIGGFFIKYLDPKTDQDDFGLFNFPEMNSRWGQDAIDAPVDSFVVLDNPQQTNQQNLDCAKLLVKHLGTPQAFNVYNEHNRGYVAANVDANKSSAKGGNGSGDCSEGSDRGGAGRHHFRRRALSDLLASVAESKDLHSFRRTQMPIR